MKRNAGFSLVELIIVIAIMAVLIGLLAPQYMRFVKRSRVVADIDNAQMMVDAINATISESTDLTVASSITGRGGDTVANVTGLTSLPASKVDPGFSWKITVSLENGVEEVLLNNKQIFPGSATDNEYYQAYYN